ncbi:hypothetical protein CH373_09925 [Leptospira perolatii]|uniref:Porin n=1 Tax=Leptospira perolatii TaxID=2023191 RepID=A0A2M9ZN56_9LEPT|nr:outer membrane beta-barrel protein [Leptospira perolatii]PJZ70181.1 hypothetical protein CH360_07670 [Leptospira perolatii]PJZ73401.1 hypothetical protein CH373_09925 [Leptospira perolatii]
MRIKTTIALAASLTLLGSSSVFAQAPKKPQEAAATATPAPAPEPEEKPWYEQVEFSGFVDVYYMYNFNPLQGNDIDSTRAFETNNKNFAVNAASLAIQKVAEKESPWGFRVDFQNGMNNAYQEAPYAQFNQIYNYNLLKQAYVTFFFPVLKGMTLDIGKMATHIGYEVLESMNNPSYSIGAIFQNTIPFIHTGARLTTQFTDKWSGTFYLYNSGGGTGYLNPLASVANPAFNNTGKNYFFESSNEHKSIGTQVKGQLIEDKLAVVWNTLYSSDGFATGYTGRVDPMKQLVASSIDPTITVGAERGKYNKDYWFMNHAILSFTPTDKIQIDLDYTWSEKAGGMSNNNLLQQQYNPTNTISVETVLGGTVSTEHTKSTYKAYGIFSKFKINDTWGVNVRVEAIDDKSNNGALTTFNPFRGPNAYVSSYKSGVDDAIAQAIIASNPALGGLTVAQVKGAMDKNYKDYGGASNYGQYKTFTITPVWNFTEHLLVKLDIRRDWAAGYQFVNLSGEKSKDQMGFTLGVVAKF